MEVKQLINTAFFVILIALLIYSYKEVSNTIFPWYEPVVSKGEVQAMKWIDLNIKPKSQFAADLFACESLTALSRQTCSIGGAWELADNPNQRYSATQDIFLTSSADEAIQKIKQYGIEYVLTAERQSFYAYGWKTPNNTKFLEPGKFRPIYSDDENKVYVFKVV